MITYNDKKKNKTKKIITYNKWIKISLCSPNILKINKMLFLFMFHKNETGNFDLNIYTLPVPKYTPHPYFF